VKKNYKYDKSQLREIKHPPLKDREKILELFNKDLKDEGYIVAIIKYKQVMHELYKRYNPWLRPVYINEQNWFMY
jgi:hypothetical protein